MLSPLLFAALVVSAPPPPAQRPASVPETVDGYSMDVLVGRWSYYVASRKGPVTRKALQAPPSIPGFRAAGRLLEMEGLDSDYGAVSASDVTRLCPLEGRQGDPNQCITVLRWAAVPDETYTDSALGKWTTSAFRSKPLVDVLKSRGVKPTADLWSQDLASAFAQIADTDAKLTQLLEIRQVDSRSCTQLATAIADLEGSTLSLTFDLPDVGTDASIEPPRPHAFRWNYRWLLRSEGGTRIEGSANSLAERLAKPLLEAAHDCGIDRKPSPAG
jgi:hypothetical protein